MKQMMTAGDVAKELGISRSTVRQYVWKGRLPRNKFGNNLIFRPKDVFDFKQSRKMLKSNVSQKGTDR